MFSDGKLKQLTRMQWKGKKPVCVSHTDLHNIMRIFQQIRLIADSDKYIGYSMI